MTRDGSDGVSLHAARIPTLANRGTNDRRGRRAEDTDEKENMRLMD
jgi:hypothetical protein